MKSIINTIYIIFFLSLSIIMLSCNESENYQSDTDQQKNTDYKENISVKEFAEQFDNLLSNGQKLTPVDDDFINGMLQLDLSNVSEYLLKIQTSGTEVDQYGIFKAKSEKAADLLANSVQAYLEMLRENWQNFNYLPEETPKINAAEVKTAALYVVFVVAAEDEKAAVFDEFYAMLND